MDLQLIITYLVTDMIPQSESRIIPAIITGVCALFAALVAVAYQLYHNRKKLPLEIKELELKVKNLEKALKSNTGDISDIKEELGISQNEDIIYQSTPEIAHFKAHGGHIWVDGKESGEKADGEMTISNEGVIKINRKNTAGKYELFLTRYKLRSKYENWIKTDPDNDTQRKFRVICQARVIDGNHSVRIALYEKDTYNFIDGFEKIHKLDTDEWKKISSYLILLPGREAGIRIDDLDVSSAPSRLEIKNIVVTQDKS